MPASRQASPAGWGDWLKLVKMMAPSNLPASSDFIRFHSRAGSKGRRPSCLPHNAPDKDVVDPGQEGGGACACRAHHQREACIGERLFDCAQGRACHYDVADVIQPHGEQILRLRPAPFDRHVIKL